MQNPNVLGGGHHGPAATSKTAAQSRQQQSHQPEPEPELEPRPQPQPELKPEPELNLEPEHLLAFLARVQPGMESYASALAASGFTMADSDSTQAELIAVAIQCRMHLAEAKCFVHAVLSGRTVHAPEPGPQEPSHKEPAAELQREHGPEPKLEAAPQGPEPEPERERSGEDQLSGQAEGRHLQPSPPICVDHFTEAAAACIKRQRSGKHTAISIAVEAWPSSVCHCALHSLGTCVYSLNIARACGLHATVFRRVAISDAEIQRRKEFNQHIRRELDPDTCAPSHGQSEGTSEDTYFVTMEYMLAIG
jgi:hypothetical protein